MNKKKNHVQRFLRKSWDQRKFSNKTHHFCLLFMSLDIQWTLIMCQVWCHTVRIKRKITHQIQGFIENLSFGKRLMTYLSTWPSTSGIWVSLLTISATLGHLFNPPKPLRWIARTTLVWVLLVIQSKNLLGPPRELRSVGSSLLCVGAQEPQPKSHPPYSAKMLWCLSSNLTSILTVFHANMTWWEWP